MEEQQKKNVPGWHRELALFFKMSCWICFPAVAGAFIGKFLDRKFHSEPWLFLFCIGFSFVLSIVEIIIIGMKEMENL
ncbi:MAG TPA: AtpZ/AtpI family protein [Candidatus Moranbacteria bacterium]|nr:AtpZ/AtpI family protein [Candidatus Moranbacteria bacterium]HSA08239.1 AtpZ/AtpI family protein [Candidatus Moranbacteria bacterium]